MGLEKVKDIDDLILDSRLGAPDFILEDIRASDFKRVYPFLSKQDLVKGVCLDYDDIIIDILEFKDETSAKDNIKNMVRCVDKFNWEAHFSQSSGISKGSYAIFFYTMCQTNKTDFVYAYKKRFGFKDLKEY